MGGGRNGGRTQVTVNGGTVRRWDGATVRRCDSATVGDGIRSRLEEPIEPFRPEPCLEVGVAGPEVSVEM